MKFAHEDIEQGLITRIRETAGVVPPPSVLTALLALTRSRADHAIASHESSADGTTWHIVASVDSALVTVDASSPRSNWMLDSEGEILADDEQLDARLRRLADVAAVQIVRTTNFDPFGEWTFNGQWRLTLRDGASIDIRAGLRTYAAREACDAFARHLIDTVASA